MSFNKVLIVGGCGFVGSNLVKEILSSFNPEKIIVVDNLISSETFNLPYDDRVQLHVGSIADDEILNKIDLDIEHIFHLACFHGNQSSIASPIQDHQNNTITSLKLFNHFAESASLKKVVYSAAGCAVAPKTYDEPNATDEDAPVSLFHDSPYSISKLIGEMYGNYFFQKTEFPFVKARFQNVYGPGELLGAGRWRGTEHTIWRNVIPTFIWKSLHNESLPLDNEGQTSRDFIFVKDIARGLIACSLNGVSGESYNLATGSDSKIIDVANIINELTGNTKPHELKPKRDWDNSGRRFGSVIKSKSELGFKAETSIKNGLAETVGWFEENFDLIQQSIDKHKISLNYFD